MASGSDSDDGEWVNVEHSADDDEGEGNGATQETEEAVADVAERAKMVSMTRLLTPADFAAIKTAQVQQAIGGTKSKKRDAKAMEPVTERRDETVSVDDVEKLHKRLKMDRDARIAAQQEGKGDKEKWLSKKEMRKKSQEIGRTNEDKRKGKNFMMVMHGNGVRRKNLMSQLERNTKARAQKRKEKTRRR